MVKFSSRDLLMARDKKKPLMIIGGPPCQPFSKNGYWITNNKRLKDLDPRNHISSFFKVVEQTKADAFLQELYKRLFSFYLYDGFTSALCN